MEISEAILAELDSKCKQRQIFLAEGYEFKAKVTPFAKNIGALVRMLGKKAAINCWSSNLDIQVQVTDMTEIQALIESLQDIIGCAFDASVDYTDERYASRTFKATNFPIEITALVGQEGEASCKSVKVGEKLIPVYEIKCEGGENGKM